MTYVVATDHFEGPFDLLLQLVETQSLPITDISLVAVTEPFLRSLEARRETLSSEELAEFLLIAAKLVYLKSKALLPAFTDPTLEAEGDLGEQLRMYQAFVQAAKLIQSRLAEGPHVFARSKQVLPVEPRFQPPPDLEVATLHDMFLTVIRRLVPLVHLQERAIERIATLEEKMAELLLRLQKGIRISFEVVAREAKNKADVVVAFLALLELTKQRTVAATQSGLFEKIELVRL